jgi:DNA adenine methylase
MKPFLKWAGGKGRLLETLAPLFPLDIGQRRLVEPFLGGGAVFFALEPTRALLGDANEDLVLTYSSIRDYVEAVIVELRFLAINHSEDFYYVQREAFNRKEDRFRPQRAAQFIYLNRTCFNGLFRVNSSGAFNVPFGRYTNPEILNEELLRTASRVLRPHRVLASSFEKTLTHEFIGPHDFVYLDPPYDPIDEDSFVAYGKGGFGVEDQKLLREHFGCLHGQGAKLMLSNSDTAFVRELYKDFDITAIRAPRSVGAAAETRKDVGEVVIRNYKGVA